MKALLAKISMHRALGLYVGEKELVLSQVASTPLGLIETAPPSQPYESGDLETAVPRLLASLLDSHKSLRLAAVGLPTSRLFFITRPVRSLDGDAKPEVLLQKALQSPNVVVDDLIVDMLKSEVNKAQMATVAACRKKYLHGVLTAAGAGGVRLFRAEPAPCALVPHGGPGASRSAQSKDRAADLPRPVEGTGDPYCPANAHRLARLPAAAGRGSRRGAERGADHADPQPALRPDGALGRGDVARPGRPARAVAARRSSARKSACASCVTKDRPCRPASRSDWPWGA